MDPTGRVDFGKKFHRERVNKVEQVWRNIPERYVILSSAKSRSVLAFSVLNSVLVSNVKPSTVKIHNQTYIKQDTLFQQKNLESCYERFKHSTGRGRSAPYAACHSGNSEMARRVGSRDFPCGVFRAHVEGPERRAVGRCTPTARRAAAVAGRAGAGPAGRPGCAGSGPSRNRP